MSRILFVPSFIQKLNPQYIMYGMTLRKRIIISIGALILFTSLTIIIVAGRSLYITGISHAYNILEMNNDSLYADVRSKLSELKNFSVTTIYNRLNKLNDPSTETTTTLRQRYVNSFAVYDKDSIIVSSIKNQNELRCAHIAAFQKSQAFFYQPKDQSRLSSICLHMPVSIQNKTYDAVFNIAPLFFNRRTTSAPTLVIAPNQFELQVQNYEISKYKDAVFRSLIDPSQILQARSNFIRSEEHVMLLQEVPRTNLRLLSYSGESTISSAYKSFLYSSFGIMILILVISIVVFFFIVSSFLKPIKNLCTASKCFADGIYEHNLDPTRFAEINELINSFNTMIRKIQQRENELSALNQNLEKEVNKKTSELLHAAKMASLGTLSSGIAHEFNNILGAVIGHVSLALEAKDPKEMEEALEIALTASEKACNIVSRLQDFAKKRSEDQIVFNVNDAIKNTLKLIERDLMNYHIKVEKKLGVAAMVRGNPAQMEQVILNLLINSKHAMENGGTITISTSISMGHVTIRVSDTGTGIKDEAKDRIFEPFFTTKGVVGMGKSFGSQDAEGTGLGLSVSMGIVEDHGGNIKLVETSERGTTFEIILPLAD